MEVKRFNFVLMLFVFLMSCNNTTIRTKNFENELIEIDNYKIPIPIKYNQEQFYSLVDKYIILSYFDDNSANMVSFLSSHKLFEIDSIHYDFFAGNKIEMYPSIDSLFESTCIDSLFIKIKDGPRILKPVNPGLGMDYLIMTLFRNHILVMRDCESGYYSVVNDDH